MKYIIYLFFRYYNEGSNKQIAFIKSLICFMFLLYINIVSLTLFIAPNLLKTFHFSSKTQTYLFLLCLFGIGYYIINKFVLEDEIKSMSPIKNVRLHGWLLFFYIFSSLALMALSLISLMNY